MVKMLVRQSPLYFRSLEKEPLFNKFDKWNLMANSFFTTVKMQNWISFLKTIERVWKLFHCSFATEIPLVFIYFLNQLFISQNKSQRKY